MKVKSITLQQIFHALTISQTASMNKAAEVLFISQPLLTNAIKKSEREVGINIFLRTSKVLNLCYILFNKTICREELYRIINNYKNGGAFSTAIFGFKLLFVFSFISFCFNPIRIVLFKVFCKCVKQSFCVKCAF